MKGAHQLHGHPKLPVGWLLTVTPFAYGKPMQVVEYQAIVHDGTDPYCSAVGDTPAAAEATAVELWKQLNDQILTGRSN